MLQELGTSVFCFLTENTTKEGLNLVASDLWNIAWPNDTAFS